MADWTKEGRMLIAKALALRLSASDVAKEEMEHPRRLLKTIAREEEMSPADLMRASLE